MRYAFVALSALFMAVPAAAQTVSNGGADAPSTSTAPQAPSQASDGETAERRICRRIETVANRTSARRVCLTQREWRDYDRNAAE
ncbi:MAG TPA: hypothetical protein VGC46_02565 [Allosphingosinicella sp.]